MLHPRKTFLNKKEYYIKKKFKKKERKVQTDEKLKAKEQTVESTASLGALLPSRTAMNQRRRTKKIIARTKIC